MRLLLRLSRTHRRHRLARKRIKHKSLNAGKSTVFTLNNLSNNYCNSKVLNSTYSNFRRQRHLKKLFIVMYNIYIVRFSQLVHGRSLPQRLGRLEGPWRAPYREPIMEVWGRNPQRGPWGVHGLVRGQGAKPPNLKAFLDISYQK